MYALYLARPIQHFQKLSESAYKTQRLSAVLNDNSPLSRLLLSSLPSDELLKPRSKGEKNDSEHEPTEHIEGTSERKHIENVRQ